MTDLTIRTATAADTGALARLAALDSAPVPAAPVLVATDGDRLIAALSTRDGAVIGDPFSRSADAIEILRRRREQLGQNQRPRRRLATSLRLALR